MKELLILYVVIRFSLRQAMPLKLRILLRQIFIPMLVRRKKVLTLKQSSNVTFFTPYRFPAQIVGKKFDKVKHEYGFAFNDEGVRFLAVKRDIDIQTEINAFENDCNIYNMLNRYMYGDLNALNKKETVYADISTTPKSLQEALNIQIRLKDDFNRMKPEVRAEFNNDFNQYIASVSSGKAFDILKKFGCKSEREVSLDQMNTELKKIKEVNNSDND